MTSETEPETSSVPPWLQATIADVELCDVNAPVVGDFVLEGVYSRAREDEKGTDAGAQARYRVYGMLAAAMGMYRRHIGARQPFGAKMEFADRRTAIVEDFRGQPKDTLARAAERSTNVVVRARLSDVVWLLDRRMADAARAAIAAYVDIVEGYLLRGYLRRHAREN